MVPARIPVNPEILHWPQCQKPLECHLLRSRTRLVVHVWNSGRTVCSKLNSFNGLRLEIDLEKQRSSVSQFYLFIFRFI